MHIGDLFNGITAHSDVKAVLAWNHPGQKRAFLLLRTDNRIQYKATASDPPGAPHGIWSWNAQDNDTFLLTWFHHGAELDAEGHPQSQPTLLKALSTEAGQPEIYRAAGSANLPENKVQLEPDEKLRHWHVVAYFVWQTQTDSAQRSFYAH